MMCDELDLPWENARVVMGSTDITPDQGGSGGSDAIETDGWPMRRTTADDAGFEAAWLAHELGRPVRVQWSREEETAWDTKGPAYTFDLRGALDANGKLIAVDYLARALDYNHLGYNEPDTVLIAQLMGRRPERPAAGGAATPASQYGIPNQRMAGQVVRLPLIWDAPCCRSLWLGCTAITESRHRRQQRSRRPWARRGLHASQRHSGGSHRGSGSEPRDGPRLGDASDAAA